MSLPYRTVIESIGTYLPPREVTTAEIIKGCARELNMPLERLTGIKSRRCAGENEFAIDLAERAVLDCLQRSHFQKDEIDVIISTNISRWDAKNEVFYEPPTSVRLKKRVGLPGRTLTIDISNACAGMWTGVFLLDALIRTGEVRCGIVVSGEYITHLIDTAQKEVVDFMDSQLASLTLGDAGAAVILSRAQSEQHGLMDFELYTLSKYSRFCIAKPTDKPHGGAAMLTDAIRVTEAVIPHAAKHAREVLRRNQWRSESVQHVIPHQTSELTMRAGIREIRKLLDYDFSDRLINNLAHRGNTSSNAHFLALHDAIQDQTIQSGDAVVFCISGSGQSTGTALYVMDNLPERMLTPKPANGTAAALGDNESFVLPMQVEVEALGLVEYTGKDEPDTIELLANAARECLSKSQTERQEVDVLIAACTYRSEFLMEPAIAALTAGDLKLNDEREPEDEHKTFAFDVVNGDLGFLKSIYLAGEFIRAGRASSVMVLASEVENNVARRPDHLLGIRVAASALMLREAVGESGFLALEFADYADEVDAREVFAGWHNEGRNVYLTCRDSESLHSQLADCLVDGTKKFLEKQPYSLDEIQWFLPSQHGDAFVAQVAERIGFDQDRVLNLQPDRYGNPMTSAFAIAIQEGLAKGSLKRGDLILMANVCAGVQVGCALYRV